MGVSLSPGVLRGRRVMDPFQHPAFRRLWAGSVIVGFANWMERVAVGWLVLEQTGSVFLAALSFAVRMAPNVLLGAIGGAVADRFERSRVLALAELAKAALVASIGVVVLAGVTAVWPVLLIVALIGVVRTAEMPSIQALIPDIVGRERAASAIGLNSLGVRSVGVLGGLSGGALTDLVGAGPVFLLGAALLVVAGAAFAGIRAARPEAPGTARLSLWGDALDGVRTMIAVPTVRVLLLLAVGVEIFAFSYEALLPAVAGRVLDVGATGLGTLTLFAGIGAVGGAATVSLTGEMPRRGGMLLAVTAGFGIFLLGFASSTRFPLSLLLVAGVGAMAAMFDALQWALLQTSVPDGMRGRVIGGWMVAIGFGWVGHVVIGATAELIGARGAIAASGAIVLLLSGVAASSALRRS